MARQLSRRMLLSSGTRAVAAALLATPFPCRNVHAGGRRQQLRVAAIGVGNRGGDNLVELQADDVSVVALCDVDDRYLQAAVKRFPAAHPYHDYRELLSSEELDAVVISSPDHSHALPALLGMRRNCHVYCEKPLAHNLRETQLLCEIANERGVVTQMANQHHASAGYRRARQLLQMGILGPIQAVHAWTLRPFWPQGIERPPETPTVPDYLNWDLWLGPAPARPYHSTYHPIGWRGWWDFGAGALGDLGTHLLEPVVTALNLDAPLRIEAESSDESFDSMPASSIIRYSFPARDDRGAIDLTWYDGGKQPPPEVSGVDRLPDDGVLVIGERGKIFIPPLGKMPRVVPASLLDAAGQLEPPPAPVGHIRQWLDAIQQKEPSRCDTPFAQGARLTNICLLGKLALRVRKPVEWDQEEFAPVNCPECLPFLAREYGDGWQIEEE